MESNNTEVSWNDATYRGSSWAVFGGLITGVLAYATGEHLLATRTRFGAPVTLLKPLPSLAWVSTCATLTFCAIATQFHRVTQ